MYTKVIILIVLFTTCVSLGQAEKVVLTEQKKGKRVVLMAENKTADTLNVFLMLNAQGYRRSADKPVLKDIPPHKKIPMITLIEMDGQDSRYTYNLIVNETRDNDLQLAYDKEVADIENLLKGKLVLFSKSDCDKCDTLAAFLEKEQIKYRVFNLDEDPTLYRQFMNFIEPQLQEETRIRFPVIWNKSYAIFGYKDLGDVWGEIEN